MDLTGLEELLEELDRRINTASEEYERAKEQFRLHLARYTLQEASQQLNREFIQLYDNRQDLLARRKKLRTAREVIVEMIEELKGGKSLS